MIDHLITAADKPTMLTLLQPLGYASATDFGPSVILNVGGENNGSIRVILSEAVWDRSNPDPHLWTLTTPEVLAAGFFVLVTTMALDPALRGLPNNACRLITDSDLALAGNPAYMLYTAPDLDLSLLNTARIEPLRAGTHYPFAPGA